jgi:hypothetical protein
VLSAIYEEDFLGFSYGFRPKRSQHDALDALIVGISSKKMNYILDADIRSFFTEVSRSTFDLFAIVKQIVDAKAQFTAAAGAGRDAQGTGEELQRRQGDDFKARAVRL